MQRLIIVFLCIAACSFAGVVTCSAPGSLQFYAGGGGLADAFFTPSNGSLSATAQACLGTGAHFNWYQIVTQDPQPPRNSTVPYVDPQPGGNAIVTGGWRDGLPWYYDEVGAGTGVACVQNGVNTCTFYDSLSWAVNSPCITYLTGQTCPLWNYTPTSDMLAFAESPESSGFHKSSVSNAARGCQRR